MTVLTQEETECRTFDGFSMDKSPNVTPWLTKLRQFLVISRRVVENRLNFSRSTRSASPQVLEIMKTLPNPRVARHRLKFTKVVALSQNFDSFISATA